jgi:tripartite ATP-independent transporter DctM subunit
MIIVGIFFILLLFMGMPVAFAIGISGVTFFLQHPEMPFTTIVQLPISQTQNFTMLALPLFILAGNLMNAAGITKRLVLLATLLTGHMRGGIAQVNVVLATLIGGVSGSATADAALQARVLGPNMLKQDFPKGYTACVIGFSSLITATIPPGVGLLLYGTIGEVSIGKLFAAGMIVGLLMMCVLMLTVRVTAAKRKFPRARETRAPFREVLGSLRETSWALAFPFLLLIGIRYGLFTPSEVGAFACLYAFLVGVFVYREITLANLFGILRSSIVDIGSIMFIIALSGIFGYGIPIDRVPQAISGSITEWITNPQLIILAILVFIIIAGMFMEGSVIILLTTPIFLPLVKSIGFDPVHFGLLMCTLTTLGILTPPVGIAMYTVCSILGCSMKEFVKESAPFFVAVFGLFAVLVYFPKIVLFLPNLLY